MLPIRTIDSLSGGENRSLVASEMEGSYSQKTNDLYLGALLVHDKKNAVSLRIKVSPSLRIHEFTRKCFVLIIELSKEL